MTYSLVFNVAGDCRYAGRSDAIGAAACVRNRRAQGWDVEEMTIPPHPTPTRRRANLAAVILALCWAVDTCKTQKAVPAARRHKVLIRSDSPATVAAVERWLFSDDNGDDAVGPAADRDLLHHVGRLHRMLGALGCVTRYAVVEREANVLAAVLAAGALDREDEGRRRLAQARLERAREALEKKLAEEGRNEEAEALERDIVKAFAEMEAGVAEGI
ncbi:hypothetical protein RB597_005235 [Gaeumannomyces tritici]